MDHRAKLDQSNNPTEGPWTDAERENFFEHVSDGGSPPLEVVLLDVDGTLVGSNEAHAMAWSRAANEFGYDRPEALFRELIGMGADQILPRIDITLQADSHSGKALAARRGEIFLAAFAPALAATPGAKALVERFRDSGLRCVIASSSRSPVSANSSKRGRCSRRATHRNRRPMSSNPRCASRTSRPTARSCSAIRPTMWRPQPTRESKRLPSGAAAGTTRGLRARSPFTTTPPTCWRSTLRHRSLRCRRTSPSDGARRKVPAHTPLGDARLLARRLVAREPFVLREAREIPACELDDENIE
jgi:hypothetical protein